MGTDIMPLADLQTMANAIAQSGLFGIKTPVQALSLMLIAQAEGLHPASAAQEYDIINGRPARKTHSVLARFQQAGGTIKWESLTDSEAIAVFSHPAGGSVRIDWTIERAKKIKSWNNKLNGGVGGWEALTDKLQWQNYPRAMLRARCIAEGIRAVYPLAIGGMLIVEEAADITAGLEEIDVTPVKVDPVKGPTPKAAAPNSPASPTGQASASPIPSGAAAPVQEPKPKTDAAQHEQLRAKDAGVAQNSDAGNPAASASAPETGELLAPNRVRIMRARMTAAGVTEEQVKQKFGKSIDQLLMSQSAAIQQFIENPQGA